MGQTAVYFFIVFLFDAFIEFGVFEGHARDQASPFKIVERVLDLVSVGHKQRVSPAEGDPDLHTGESPWPAEDNPPHCAGHATVLTDEGDDGRFTAVHVVRRFICPTA